MGEMDGMRRARPARWQRRPGRRWLLRTGVAVLAAVALRGPSGVLAVAQPSPPSSAGPAVFLDGTPHDPRTDDQHIVLLVFLAVDCPIANRYAPELSRIARTWSDRHVRVWTVYPDPDTTPERIAVHRAAYALPGHALRDPTQALSRAAGVRVTPEVALFFHGSRRYVGRIDDRAVDFGVFRSEASDRTLERALEAVAAGRPAPVPMAPAVGCVIADLTERP